MADIASMTVSGVNSVVPKEGSGLFGRILEGGINLVTAIFQGKAANKAAAIQKVYQVADPDSGVPVKNLFSPQNLLIGGIVVVVGLLLLGRDR